MENLYKKRSGSRGSRKSHSPVGEKENNYQINNQNTIFNTNPTNKNQVVLLSGGSVHDRRSSIGSSKQL